MSFTVRLPRLGLLYLVFGGIEYDEPFGCRFFGKACWLAKVPLFQIQYYSRARRLAVTGR